MYNTEVAQGEVRCSIRKGLKVSRRRREMVPMSQSSSSYLAPNFSDCQKLSMLVSIWASHLLTAMLCHRDPPTPYLDESLRGWSRAMSARLSSLLALPRIFTRLDLALFGSSVIRLGMRTRDQGHDTQVRGMARKELQQISFSLTFQLRYHPSTLPPRSTESIASAYTLSLLNQLKHRNQSNHGSHSTNSQSRLPLCCRSW